MHRSISNDYMVAMGDGTGTFNLRYFPLGRPSATTLALADFDGDGDCELAVGYVDPMVTVLHGQPDGSFDSPLGFGTRPPP